MKKLAVYIGGGFYQKIEKNIKWGYKKILHTGTGCRYETISGSGVSLY